MNDALAGARVLVASANISVRAAAREALNAAGASVLTAVDGPAAMRAAVAERPDAMALDADLPGIDGYQLCRLLRVEPATSGAPIVILAQRDNSLAAFHSRSAGADGVVACEEAPARLVALLRTVWARRSDAEPPPRPAVDGLSATNDDLFARLARLLDRDLLRATLFNDVNALAEHIEDLPLILERLGEMLRRIVPATYASLTFHAPPSLFSLYPTPLPLETLWEFVWREATWSRTAPAPFQPSAVAQPKRGAAAPLDDARPRVVEATPHWRLVLWLPPAFQPSDDAVDLLGAFTRAAALVVSNARLHAEVQRLALTDDLTGLYNRRLLRVRLESELARAGRTGGSLGVILADLDQFKSVNDRFGHLTGDAALRLVAGVLAGIVRPYDVVGRFGGEEFIVLAPDSSLDGTARLAERARRRLATLTVPDTSVPLSASFGVAATNGDAPDADTLLRRADEALYRAKARGRNRVEVYETPADDADRQR